MEGQFAMEMAVLSLTGEFQRGIQRTRRGKGCPLTLLAGDTA